MNLFLSKKESLTLGLIMHKIGNDSKIIDKIKSGYNKGLFELALHGWDHEDFSKLKEQEQQNLLQNANNKMEVLFGKKSEIFIPPYDPFNNDTIKAMNQIGIPIISSLNYEENNFDNKSIFNSKYNIQNEKIKINNILHIPGTIEFRTYINNSWHKEPLDNISNAITNNLNHYGYAVIVLHPQDFLKIDKKGNLSKEFDINSINDLSFLLDNLKAKKIPVVSFNKLSNY
ncbi:MAG TPA: polysaccharide deacetylase family protein [Candidatus Sulfopaludibacter sp.]|jgi:peptidoglycan/xylan/chitin deacetylase (PgdA/CDA1 family)|nr:polysaccharide deacetylase family protein [Candidatus Sulfopaludibacter sp.]